MSTLILETPIKRGDTTITEVTLTKPTAGALRGVALLPMLQMDVNALAMVLPRITTPTLTQPEVLAMDPADLMQFATEVTGFLLPKNALADIPTT